MSSELYVLAVDDDRTQIELIKTFCHDLTYPSVTLFTAETAEEAYAILERETIDLVLSDYRLPTDNGNDILTFSKQLNPLIQVVIMTAFENTHQAVDVLKNGASDYLVKPTKRLDLERLFVRVHESIELEREDKIVRQEIEETFGELPIIFKSREMAEVLSVAQRSARTNSTILITGESGTGKELVARMIHQLSPRKNRAFVTVNISSLTSTLVESELFGHRKGSFTGAEKNRIGRFEEADGGSLFIDEVGDIAPEVQVKLLRFLQFGEITRVGENIKKELDVRIIAATNRDLRTMITDGEFRSDLYYRLNVIPIYIPPLRERKVDIPPLVEHFVDTFAKKNNKEIKSISREALDKIMRYPFPGNIRELENLIERAIILSRGDIFRMEDIQSIEQMMPLADHGVCDEPELGEYETIMKDFETALIEKALSAASGNQTKAAKLLSISERHLRSRMDKLEIINKWK